MSLRKRLYQNWAEGLVGALLATALGLIFLLTRLGEGYTHLSYDLPFAFRPDLEVEGVVIVYLDEESYRELYQEYTTDWRGGLPPE